MIKRSAKYYLGLLNILALLCSSSSAAIIAFSIISLLGYLIDSYEKIIDSILHLIGVFVVIIILGHSIVFPFLFFVYFPLSIYLWRKRAKIFMFPLAGSVIAFISSFPIIFDVWELKELDYENIMGILLFVISGFFTGLIHYFLLRKLNKHPDQLPAAVYDQQDNPH